MEIAQLYTTTNNNQLQLPYVFVIEKDVSNMAGEHPLAEPKLKVIP